MVSFEQHKEIIFTERIMPRKDLREDASELLPWYRVDPTLWSDFDFAPDYARNEFDAHHRWRYAILIALQFDRQPADETLLRYILLQEAIFHHHLPLAGHYLSLSLAAHLLSAYRHVENIAAFVEAKMANGDAFLAIDVDVILLCGGDAVRGFLQHWDHPHKDWIMALTFYEDGEPIYSQKTCEARWQREEQRFPANPEDVGLHMQIMRAFAFENFELARQLVDRYERNGQPSHNHYHELSRLRRKLGQWKEALLALLAELKLREPTEAQQINTITAQLAKFPDESEDIQRLLPQFEQLMRPYGDNEIAIHLALSQLYAWLKESS